jgi:hypothetical protein
VLSDVVVYLIVREENGQIRVCGCILVQSGVENMLYNLIVLLTLSFRNDFPVGKVAIRSICVEGRDVFVPLAGVREIWRVVGCDVVALVNVCLHCGFCNAQRALSAVQCFFQGLCLSESLVGCISWVGVVFFLLLLISLRPPIASPVRES